MIYDFFFCTGSSYAARYKEIVWNVDLKRLVACRTGESLPAGWQLPNVFGGTARPVGINGEKAV